MLLRSTTRRSAITKPRKNRLDLQAKVSLVLLGVIMPTFLIVTVAQNALTRPLLENEMKAAGITVAQTLSDEITDSKWLQLPSPTLPIESRIQELLYTQPQVIRMDVVVPSDDGVTPRLMASNLEGPLVGGASDLLVTGLASKLEASIIADDDGSRLWKIQVPVLGRNHRVNGNVVVLVALKLVERIQVQLWKSTIVAGLVALFALFLGLRFFLRRTLENERRLIAAEDQNLQLTEQLHETQRQLMNTEKLAVMGQLTATFAHEIGTPLNAVGGHLQLLSKEVQDSRGVERLGIIRGQLEKIEGIVRGFLQSTALPPSQRQLVDVNRVAEQTLSIVLPRAESLGVTIGKSFDRALGPVRIVPLELEQILLNLVNNSLDSLRSKIKGEKGIGVREYKLELVSKLQKEGSRSYAVLEVFDTGEGISEEDLMNVWKPFYTTKRPGEGTGLGLTICQQLARQNGAMLEVTSKKGSWTRMTLRMPYA